jgi:hypothetical protein
VRKGISWAWVARRRLEAKRAVAIVVDFMVGKAFVLRRCGSRYSRMLSPSRIAQKYVTHVTAVGDGV